ncbi:unnamed protein product [Aphanomyces euteiches]|uniref:HSF-type DNA-binding domain-containing protein n=1 Tax=Aphanomyces euteiches TaxID=100861 RepID=A0A6G0X7Y2_9STRA|nr:hypothetical protein Ae201684_007201 [Aphanomyces euteiches]KAH9100572.1 hypothetical protein Ae201684P_006768 [Aphanomyces euteiches]KAH9139302.1 hypothetical protein AeRB84_016422 [Aphanomyces euteiches]
MTASAAAAFVRRLYFLLETTTSSCSSTSVGWSSDGLSFYIHEPTLFAKHVLPKFFNHSKLATFVRDLSHYGFHKVAQAADRLDVIEYCHVYFHRGNIKALKWIQKSNKPNLDVQQRKVVDEIEGMVVNIKRQVLSEQARNAEMADYLSCIFDNPAEPTILDAANLIEASKTSANNVEWSDYWLNDFVDPPTPLQDTLCIF